MSIVTVDARDPKAAIDICRELIDTGRANLFRGQTIDWPRLTPSLFRKTEIEKDVAEAELASFFEWANGIPQMHPYHRNDDALTAIAQHYGIATNFLDLTTDPEIALSFAKGGSNTVRSSAIIYCFLEQELQRIDGVQIVRLNVDNLWRLEIQKGLFLKYDTEDAVDAVKSCAIHLAVPRSARSEEEDLLLYPPRKSALESVIDQWLYKRHLENSIDLIAGSIQYKRSIRRQTYPGIFRSRVVPEISSAWIGNDPRWINAPVESVHLVGQPIHLRIQLRASEPRHIASEVRKLIAQTIFESIATGRLLRFDLEVVGKGKRHSQSLTKIANWAWDGMRVVPFLIEEYATAMANILTILTHITKGTKYRSNINELMFGSTQIIDVAPVGGHIESGHVSEAAYIDARTFVEGKDFTDFALGKLAKGEGDDLSDFITDPWLLFNFGKFKKLYIEQFVPSAVGSFWESDLEHHRGKLGTQWSVPFNPALLGYVSNFRYRFTSPLVYERDVERLVLITSEMSKRDIHEAFLDCMPHILSGGGPFHLRMHGYGFDQREIYDIPEAVQQLRWVVEVHGISVLNVLPSAQLGPENENGFPDGLCAFHVWLIAKGLLKEVVGKHPADTATIWEEFRTDLLLSNERIELAYKRSVSRGVV